MAEVEVDEMFGLMCHEGAEVAADDAMPGWAFTVVELGVVSCLNGDGEHLGGVRFF